MSDDKRRLPVRSRLFRHAGRLARRAAGLRPQALRIGDDTASSPTRCRMRRVARTGEWRRAAEHLRGAVTRAGGRPEAGSAAVAVAPVQRHGEGDRVSLRGIRRDGDAGAGPGARSGGSCKRQCEPGVMLTPPRVVPSGNDCSARGLIPWG